MKLDFGVVLSSPMYQNFKIVTYYHPGNNRESIFHRYTGLIYRYLAQGDFGDGLATNGLFREVSSSQNPPKISRCARSTFFEQLFFWTHANRITELGARRVLRGSVCWGGSPSPNPTAYSQLDEMTHVFSIVHMI